MTDVFQNVLTASFHGSIVILVVILLRLLLKKTPKKFLCFLWLLAGIRLLMPFEIRSGLSLQPDVDTVVESRFLQESPLNEVTAVTPEPMEEMPPIQEGQILHNYMPEEPALEEQAQTPVEEPMVLPADPLARLDEIAACIWVGVAFCFLLHTLGSYLRLKLRVREAIRIRDNIWECDRIETAFILGFIRPRIYLPMGMSRNNRRHILAHERTHLEKGDHWFKMVGYIALAIHWFNPLVWVAYIMLCKDIEMACDERVVQFMELEERKSYSAALLNCSTNHAHFAACPVAFGEVSVKNRVLSVLNYKKPSFWISLAGVIAILFVAVCLVTSPVEKAEVSAEEAVKETLPPREVVTVATVDALINAIAPNTEIVLEAGTYNLSASESYAYSFGGEYFSWGQVYDGYELILRDLDNFAIRGNGMHVTLLETDPRYANVIRLENCSNVEIMDITMGHTRERGECSGGVVSLWECTGIDLRDLGLYGCGVVGLNAESCADVQLRDSDIYECSGSAANLGNSQNVAISDCRIYSIGSVLYGGYTFFEVRESQNVAIKNCELLDSQLSHMLCAYGSSVEMKNNRIANNRIAQGALSLQNNNGSLMEVILENNKFQDNIIRLWYDLSNFYASDEKGRLLTEDVLMDAYGTELTEPKEPQLQIHVATVDEFIAAIGSNKEIILDAALYDLSTATGYGTTQGAHFYWEDIFDGPGLVIRDVTNMTIRSNDGDVKGHTISAVPRYADVLAFKGCSDITVSGFTAGHTKEQGSCAGGVLEFRDCDVITVDNCGLFGCGILGVETQSCTDLTVKNCEIYECSTGGIKLWDTYGAVIQNTTFRDIGGDSIMNFNSCKNVTVDGETVLGETLGSYVITTPEQEDQHAFERVVYDFIYYFRTNRREELKNLLSDSYAGEVTVWSEGDDYADTMAFSVEPEDLAELKKTGSRMFQVGFGKWSFEKSAWEEEGAVLNFTVIQEKGEYKISDYYLVLDEA